MREHGPDRPQTAQVRAKSSIIQQGGGPLNLLRQERLRLMDAPQGERMVLQALNGHSRFSIGGWFAIPYANHPEGCLAYPSQVAFRYDVRSTASRGPTRISQPGSSSSNSPDNTAT